MKPLYLSEEMQRLCQLSESQLLAWNERFGHRVPLDELGHYRYTIVRQMQEEATEEQIASL